MRRKALAHQLLDFRVQVFRAPPAGFQTDVRLDDLGALRVWLADDRDFRHRRMLHHHTFDVERTDAVAGRSDDVVVATERLVCRRSRGVERRGLGWGVVKSLGYYRRGPVGLLHTQKVRNEY